MKRFKIRVACLLLNMIFLPWVGLAGDGLVKTPAGSYLKIGVGPRALSLGEAYVSLCQDATSLYWNPAGLSLMKVGELMLSSNDLSLNSRQDLVLMAFPMRKKFGLGFYGNYYSIGDIERRSGPVDVAEGKVEAKNILLGAGLGVKLRSDLSLGISGKYINETLDKDKAKSFGVDLGMMGKVSFLEYGVSLQNLGGKMGFVNKSYELPLMARAGISLNILKDRLTLALGVRKVINNKENDKVNINYGVEFSPLGFMVFRVGYKQSFPQNLLKYGLGIGLKISPINLDYAYLPFEDIGDTHRLALTFRERDKKVKAIKRIEREEDGLKGRVVILRFINNTGDKNLDWLEKGISDMLTTELSNSKYLRIVETELIAPKDGIINDELATKIKRETKADYILSGSYLKVGDKIRCQSLQHFSF